MILLSSAAAAEPIRIAVYHTELSRDGPGLMLRDILSEEDPQILAVTEIANALGADVLVLGGIDWDRNGAGLAALNALLGYHYVFTAEPNRGRRSGLDIDGDGRLREPEDHVGYAEFRGQEGLAVLSRFPIELVGDLSQIAWGDIAGGIGPPVEALADLPISTTAHWHLSVDLPDGSVSLLVWHATPPVFDGPEDRNGRRNHDEAAVWFPVIEGAAGPVVLAGFANLDPIDGDGRPEAFGKLLAHPRLVDPLPSSRSAVAATEAQAGANASHRGPATLDTVDWGDEGQGPGNLRVDYILPSRDLRVIDAGVLWPEPGDPLLPAIETASRHRPVWVDVELPGAD